MVLGFQNIGYLVMRRRQLFELRERELIAEREKAKENAKMGIKVPNSNIISDSAQPELKAKAAMFLPNEADIVKPNGTPYRKRGSKPGARAANPTAKKNSY